MTSVDRSAIKVAVVCGITGVWLLCFYLFGVEPWARYGTSYHIGVWLSIGLVVIGFCTSLYEGIRKYENRHKRKESD